MKFRYYLIIITLLLFTSCSSTQDNNLPYDIIGTIESINHSQSGNITSCLIVATDSSSTYRHAHIRIIGDTQIHEKDSIVSVGPGHLEEKMLVGVRFKGAIAESDPIQVNASEIVILE